MKRTILILFLILSFIINNVQSQDLITPQVKAIFEEINLARSNPKEYAVTKHLESLRLDTLKSKLPFALNYNLCKKADYYAYYLSKLKYNHNSVTCEHSDFGLNESINFCDPLEECVSKLIIDKSVKDADHRFHILGVNNKDTKIGIGVAYCKDLEWYIVVIVTEY